MFQMIKTWLKLWWIAVLIDEYDATVDRLIALEKGRTLGIYKYTHTTLLS